MHGPMCKQGLTQVVQSIEYKVETTEPQDVELRFLDVCVYGSDPYVWVERRSGLGRHLNNEPRTETHR